MAESWNNSGLAMMLVGGLMVVFAVAIIGLVSIGVGARKRRT
jgi:hypothetical protein